MSTQIALGTYRITDDEPLHIEAIKTAIDAGIRLIDTSTNYMDGHAERAIAAAKAHMPNDAWKDVEIVSKFGYVQGSTMQRLKEDETFNNVVKHSDQVWHCIDPDFMRDQLTQSLNRLECETIDCYLLHNPEYFLLDAIHKGISMEQRLDEMLQRILDTFIGLEQEVAKGRIKSYGISSNSFAKEVDDPEFLPYEDLITLAQNAAKHAGNDQHHFTTVQLPVNLLESEGFKCAAWAKDHGLRVLANRPLNAQKANAMYRLADYAEPLEYHYYLNELINICEENALVPLQNLLQELDANVHRFHWIGDYEHFYFAQVLPTLQKMIQSIDEGLQQSMIDGLNIFLSEYKKMVQHECAKQTRDALQTELAGCDKSLQACAIEYLRRDEIDYILVGMRRPTYVHDIVSL